MADEFVDSILRGSATGKIEESQSEELQRLESSEYASKFPPVNR